MQALQSTGIGTENTTFDLFKQIESSTRVIQNFWNDITAKPEGYISVINQANKSIDIIEYLDTRYEIEYVSSSNEWHYKMRCPFHKYGDERTASCFINKEQGRFFCQACGKTGGIVEYLSFKYKRPAIVVAENILYCLSGNFVIDQDVVNKSNERKKNQKLLLALSDIYRGFISKYIDDEEAIKFINKCYSSFDSLLITNSANVEKNLEEIITQFEMYVKKYDERKVY